ncbi:hypothetical protein J3R30DRAFT_745639 [Lentinula aciculospora]|uniref:Uncharacterized protein n=1 Tax=Lentinula aciculospora TaxID=153920 RepID=A0A9W9A2I6_9AGAR|nr:hypothetical protein J3R30DRAFT_745639 [Lentinula aciculospora]
MTKSILPISMIKRAQFLYLCISFVIFFSFGTIAVPLPSEGSAVTPNPTTSILDLPGQVLNISNRAPKGSTGPSTLLYYASCLSFVEPIKKDGLEKHSTPTPGALSFDRICLSSVEAMEYQ